MVIEEAQSLTLLTEMNSTTVGLDLEFTSLNFVDSPSALQLNPVENSQIKTGRIRIGTKNHSQQCFLV